MRKGFQENLRRFAALLCLVGLTGAAHAGLIPDGTQILFSTNSYSVYNNSGKLHFMAPDNLYSASGKVYLTNGDILKAYKPKRWFMSFGQGLDAVTFFNDPATGQMTTWFSTGRTFHSNSRNEQVGEGDLLDRNGTTVATNQQLIANFGATTGGVGLDAVDVINPGTPDQQIWFSSRNGFHSDALNEEIGAGDLISNTGQVIARNADLLKAFAPSKPDVDYGLDAVHVLNSLPGQAPIILFSTAKDFYSEALGRKLSRGDILASDGEVVMSNADLMKNFGWHWPANPGVDAIAFLPGNEFANVSRTLETASKVSPPATPVPDPATLCLLAVGAALVAARKR